VDEKEKDIGQKESQEGTDKERKPKEKQKEVEFENPELLRRGFG